MKRITLQQARDANLIRYLPLSPCRNGHTCQRFTHTNACCECTRIALHRGRGITRKVNEPNNVYNMAHRLFKVS